MMGCRGDYRSHRHPQRVTIAIVFWSFAAMGHAISGTVASFILWRVLLGLGEAANFPHP